MNLGDANTVQDGTEQRGLATSAASALLKANAPDSWVKLDGTIPPCCFNRSLQ